MTAEQPIETAPQDGTRVLIKSGVYDWARDRHGHRFHKLVGSVWTECRFIDGRWHEWAGTENRTVYGGSINPLAWAPLPRAADGVTGV